MESPERMQASKSVQLGLFGEMPVDATALWYSSPSVFPTQVCYPGRNHGGGVKM